MTLDQDGRSQTSVETGGRLVQQMVGLMESGYRPVNKDGFLMTQDRAAVSGLIHLVRADIAKTGPAGIVKRKQQKSRVPRPKLTPIGSSEASTPHPIQSQPRPSNSNITEVKKDLLVRSRTVLTGLSVITCNRFSRSPFELMSVSNTSYASGGKNSGLFTCLPQKLLFGIAAWG